jgi:hypothetical protein
LKHGDERGQRETDELVSTVRTPDSFVLVPHDTIDATAIPATNASATVEGRLLWGITRA